MKLPGEKGVMGAKPPPAEVRLITLREAQDQTLKMCRTTWYEVLLRPSIKIVSKRYRDSQTRAPACSPFLQVTTHQYLPASPASTRSIVNSPSAKLHVIILIPVARTTKLSHWPPLYDILPLRPPESRVWYCLRPDINFWSIIVSKWFAHLFVGPFSHATPSHQWQLDRNIHRLKISFETSAPLGGRRVHQK